MFINNLCWFLCAYFLQSADCHRLEEGDFKRAMSALKLVSRAECFCVGTKHSKSTAAKEQPEQYLQCKILFSFCTQ